LLMPMTVICAGSSGMVRPWSVMRIGGWHIAFSAEVKRH
jgi:hypothetical protein